MNTMITTHVINKGYDLDIEPIGMTGDVTNETNTSISEDLGNTAYNTTEIWSTK